MAGTTHTITLDYGDLETTQAGFFQVSCPTYGTLASTAPALTTLYTGKTIQSVNSIAIGVDGLPITVFNQSDPYAVKIAHCQDFACTQVTINSIDGGLFYKGALAIGADGLPILIYSDINLKVAHDPGLHQCGHRYTRQLSVQYSSVNRHRSGRAAGDQLSRRLSRLCPESRPLPGCRLQQRENQPCRQRRGCRICELYYHWGRWASHYQLL